jgi:hypothetical protein
LIRDNPVVGRSDFGPYYCYSVLSADGTELSFFATPEIHQVILEQKLGKGSQFILRRPAQTNGKKPKLEIALIAKEEPTQVQDDLKDILLRCVQDAAEVVRQSGLQFDLDSVQKLSVALLIARTRA